MLIGSSSPEGQLIIYTYITRLWGSRECRSPPALPERDVGSVPESVPMRPHVDR
jgi:hypothetical protein